MADIAARQPRRASPGRIALRVGVCAYLGVLVLVPLIVVAWHTFAPGWAAFVAAVTDPLAMHAFLLTGEIAAISVVLNTVFGVGAAILIARYSFPGRRLLNALIGLPVSISPIVVGFAIVVLYGSAGWFGAPLESVGIQVILSLPGMVIATMIVSLPLVARAVFPVVQQLDREQEEAAASLGAGAFTRFWRITLPAIRFAVATGVVLSLARCIGEYGAVLVVSGNVQGLTETATLRISNLYQNSLQPDAAYAITCVLVIVTLVAIALTVWLRRGAQAPS